MTLKRLFTPEGKLTIEGAEILKYIEICFLCDIRGYEAYDTRDLEAVTLNALQGACRTYRAGLQAKIEAIALPPNKIPLKGQKKKKKV